MPFYVYIIQSTSSQRYYCGSTHDLHHRINQHNDPLYIFTKTTKRFQGPWILIFSKEFASRSKAMAYEKLIKRRGISRFLNKITQPAESRRWRD
jgi:putative endonuclease